MAYTLPPLPYAYNALEPHIDARTMEIHHTKHHQAYINNVNNAINGTDLEKLPVEQLIADLSKVPENIRGVVRNNGGAELDRAHRLRQRGWLRIEAPDRLRAHRVRTDRSSARASLGHEIGGGLKPFQLC